VFKKERGGETWRGVALFLRAQGKRQCAWRTLRKGGRSRHVLISSQFLMRSEVCGRAEGVNRRVVFISTMFGTHRVAGTYLGTFDARSAPYSSSWRLCSPEKSDIVHGGERFGGSRRKDTPNV
jgi:hypothetical protein